VNRKSNFNKALPLSLDCMGTFGWDRTMVDGGLNPVDQSLNDDPLGKKCFYAGRTFS
jgi:hypothetical protein